MPRPTLHQATRLHKSITDRAYKLLRERGAPVSYSAVMLRGAVSALDHFRVPVSALGVRRELLELSGHSLGQEALPEQDWDMPPEGFESWDEYDQWLEEQYGGPPPHGYDTWDDWEAEQYGERVEEDEPVPGPPAPPSPEWVAPGAVPIRPANWDLDPEPARYRVAAGDTLAGLAATYLGSGGRWREIWELNPTVTNPNNIYVGQWLAMPEEAVETLLAHTEKTGEAVKGEEEIPWALYLGIGAAVAAAAAAVYTFTT